MASEETDELDLKEFNSERIYTGIDFKEKRLTGLFFEDCRFVSCQFDYADLSEASFTDCGFERSSFAVTKCSNTVFNEVLFSGCKIQGFDFGSCNDFLLSFRLEDSVLDHVYISEKKLKKTGVLSCRIKDCEFSGVDFTDSDFSESVFADTIFHRCNLERADFRTAAGYRIDPENNRLKRARFSLPEAASFLSFLEIVLE